MMGCFSIMALVGVFDDTLDDGLVEVVVRIELGELGKRECRIVGLATVERGQNRHHGCRRGTYACSVIAFIVALTCIELMSVYKHVPVNGLLHATPKKPNVSLRFSWSRIQR